MTVLRRTLTARGASFGALVVVLVVLMAVLAPVLSPYDPLKQDVSNLLSAPNLGHLLAPTTPVAMCCRA